MDYAKVWGDSAHTRPCTEDFVVALIKATRVLYALYTRISRAVTVTVTVTGGQEDKVYRSHIRVLRRDSLNGMNFLACDELTG